jgi:hypothetical protein
MCDRSRHRLDCDRPDARIEWMRPNEAEKVQKSHHIGGSNQTLFVMPLRKSPRTPSA